MARAKQNLDERVRELELELLELEEQYKTQLYFETMPEYDPTYKYCYSSASRSVPQEHQHIDYWIRAVMRHMATRREGHGGASTSALLISVPIGLSEVGVNEWIEYISNKLKKEAVKHRKRMGK